MKRKQKTAVPDCVNSFFLIGEIKLSGNYRGDSLLQPQAPRRTAAGNSEVVYLYIWGHEDSGNLFALRLFSSAYAVYATRMSFLLFH